jgi:4-hydroxy 2-oxovalerate aldolase
MLDVLYFADSLGSMDGGDVVRIISALKLNWIGEVGFHAHNNKGLAVSNTLVAIENGATWVDSTILGMGRGAGNAQTENLLLELKKKYQLDYRASALFDLALSDFTPLQNHFHWGKACCIVWQQCITFTQLIFKKS